MQEYTASQECPDMWRGEVKGLKPLAFSPRVETPFLWAGSACPTCESPSDKGRPEAALRDDFFSQQIKKPRLRPRRYREIVELYGAKDDLKEIIHLHAEAQFRRLHIVAAEIHAGLRGGILVAVASLDEGLGIAVFAREFEADGEVV